MAYDRLRVASEHYFRVPNVSVLAKDKSLGLYDRSELSEVEAWADGFALLPFDPSRYRYREYASGVAYNRLFSNPSNALSTGLVSEHDLMKARALAFVRGDLGGLTRGNDFTEDALMWARAMASPGSRLATLNGNFRIRPVDLYSAIDVSAGRESGGVSPNTRPDLPNTDFAVSYDGIALAWIDVGESYVWRAYCNVGAHTFRMEYANGLAVNAQGTWTFNGGQAIDISTVAIPTGGFSSYTNLTLSTSINLVRGWNTITFVPANSLNININAIEIQRN